MTLFQTLKLLIPALIPSWNFFDVITASPRIQFTLLWSENDTPGCWIEYRPRPAHLSLPQMLERLFWNARWNETMFVIGCAERLLVNPTRHSENEILYRIKNDLQEISPVMDFQGATHLQFRILLIERQGEELNQESIYYSRIATLSKRKTT